MSTCSRQLSTFERSFDSGSAVSVVSLIAASVRPPIDEPCLQKFAFPWPSAGPPAQRRKLLLRPCDRLVEPPREGGEPGVEDGPLRLRLGHERLDAPAKLRLGFGQAALQVGDEVVTLPLEARDGPAHPLLEAPRARVADLRQPLREHLLGLARECLHPTVELARETPRRVFALALDRVGELLPR